MQIRFSRQFKKDYQKVDKKVKSNFENRLELFLKHPFNPQLNNHALTGKYKGYRSINITGDWRAIYSVNKINKEIIFETIGTHSQLYK